MRQRAAFDAFCRARRSAILHQTYAFAGEPETAQRATRDAFAQAGRHRRALLRDPDGDAWLRTRAFRASGEARNQGRRPWYARAADIDDAHRPLLLGLQDLSPTDRTLVILRYLAGLDLTTAARQAGVSDRRAAELLDLAVEVLRRRLPDLTEETLPAALGGLGDDLVGMPVELRSGLSRDGGGRRRAYLAVAGVAVLAALVTAGVLRSGAHDPGRVVTPRAGASRPRPVPPSRVRVSQLLSPDQVRGLDTSARWRIRSTWADPAGSTRAARVCRPLPAADPHAVRSSWVRSFGSGRGGHAWQLLQVSSTTADARSAYRRALLAYGRCVARGGRLTAYERLRHTGDQAALVEYRPARRSADSTVTVGVARTGLVVTTIVADLPGSARPPAVARVVQRAVDKVCRDSTGRCSTAPATLSASMPPSTAADGNFLAVVDLPPPAGRRGRWVATTPEVTRENPAATLCDQMSFGSTRHRRTRSFVVDAAPGVPDTFGLTETTGRLATRTAARQVVDHVHAAVSTCHHRQLSVRIGDARRLTGPNGAHGYVWSVNAQVSANRSQRYLTAVIRVRRTVAQLTFTPTDSYPLSTARFVRLVHRAAHRLAR